VSVGTYFTTASPQTLAGLVMQSETRVRVGTSRLWASLEVLSKMYTTYTASVGLQTASSFDLGELTSLGFEHVPTFEQPDSTNVLQSSLQTLTEEETTITMGVYQFDVRLLEIAVGTGVMYTTGTGGNERFMTVGGKCNTARRPLEISATNIGCNAPAAVTSVLTGVSAIVITVYDAQCTSGLPWSDIVANELNVLDLEWTAFPVDTLALGNKLFSLYVF
jgi:hypothetical protein